MNERLHRLLWPLMGLGVGVLIFGAQPQVHALPEYATRTGESCATCHVNPAGGGPRTLRGSLWIAQGKPDQVPQLPGSAEPESTTAGDGQALYAKYGCVGCHGAAGEGALGPALDVPGAADAAEQVIRNGVGTMRAFKPDTLSDADLAAIVQFTQALARGEAKTLLDASPRPLQPRESSCGSAASGGSPGRSCGGN